MDTQKIRLVADPKIALAIDVLEAISAGDKVFFAFGRGDPRYRQRKAILKAREGLHKSCRIELPNRPTTETIVE